MSSSEPVVEEMDYVELHVPVIMLCVCVCVAEWRSITQHYVAMTKQKAEASDPVHSRHAHPPACELTIQCHWEITASPA